MTEARTEDGSSTALRARLEEVLRARLAAHDAAGTADQGGAAGRLGFATHVNPDLARILAAVRLDRQYVSGRGLELVDDAGRRCLDFAGAYGALPFGHNPGAVWDALLKVRHEAEPAFVQPSILGAAGELAARLAGIAPPGLDRVTLVNSGAEAIEVALKIARSSTGRRGILSAHNSFHGKTLGALSATGRPQYQADFGAPAEGFHHVPFGDVTALGAALEAHEGTIAAVILEPIQGEGGVRVPPPTYLRDAHLLCREHGALLVLDEVQTGLGRTGSVFASQQHGVVPDVVTVAKALGGGILPIGAVITREALMTESFALRHTSTFAGGAPACRVGLAVLDILEADGRAVLTNVRNRSRQLLDGLVRIADRHPGVISDVRGEGLLIGLELSDDLNLTGDQGFLASMASSETLGMILSSYLLAVEGIRVAPTLFGARVIRVEPPLNVTESQCAVLLDAVERAIALVAQGEAGVLLAHLVGRDGTGLLRSALPIEKPVPRVLPGPAARQQDERFAFIVHPLDFRGLEDFEPAVAHFTMDERRQLLTRFADASSPLSPAPFVVGGGAVTTGSGSRVFGELIGIPFTADQLLALPAARATQVVREACELAVERGAQIVGLGAYSSIVTRNATTLGDVGVPLTTGNTFTAAAAVRAVVRTAADTGTDLGGSCVAIVGAGGSIGRAIAAQLAPRAGRMVLVGRPGGDPGPRMLRTAHVVAEAIGEDLADLEGRGVVVLTDDIRWAAARADVLITASSSPTTLVEAAHLKVGAIVCDVAQPPNIAASASRERPDVTVFDGGIVTLPPQTDFALRYGLPPGLTYACMAETMILSLERAASGHSGSAPIGPSIGEDLDVATLVEFGECADRHGFRLAPATTWRSSHGSQAIAGAEQSDDSNGVLAG